MGLTIRVQQNKLHALYPSHATKKDPKTDSGEIRWNMCCQLRIGTEHQNQAIACP